MKKLLVKNCIVVFLLSFFSIYAIGQDTLFLDLAANEPGSIKSIQGNKSYDLIVLENVVSGFIYSIETTNIPELLPVLLPALKYGNSELTEAEIKDESCEGLSQKIMDLKNFQQKQPEGQERSEKKLSEIVASLEAELIKGSCDSSELYTIAKFWLESTQKVYNEKIDIRTGDKVTITIKRDTLEWIFIFKGAERGKWVTTYGFGFTFAALEEETYYTKQIPDTALFKILKAEDPSALELNFVPAIFFSYFPIQNFNKKWNHSLSAGLGFDLTAPVVFLGYNGLFNHNIGFSAGLAFQQQNRLKTQYKENETISITLDEDQLHDKVYRPNLFVSINFRFGENPFKSEKETAKD